jgi:hypothetical protein
MKPVENWLCLERGSVRLRWAYYNTEQCMVGSPRCSGVGICKEVSLRIQLGIMQIVIAKSGNNTKRSRKITLNPISKSYEAKSS